MSLRRALCNRSIELNIFTGLSLRSPQASSEIERRFLDPFVARVFGNCPDLDYVAAVRGPGSRRRLAKPVGRRACPMLDCSGEKATHLP